MAGSYPCCQRGEFTERFWLSSGPPGTHFSNDVRVTDIEYEALGYMRGLEDLTAYPGFLLAWQHVGAKDDIDFCTIFPLTNLIRIASGFQTAGAAPSVSSAAVRRALAGLTPSFCDMSNIHLLPDGHERKTCAPLHHDKFDRMMRFLGSRSIQRHLGSLSCGFMFFFKGVIDVVLCIVNGCAADGVKACIADVERYVCTHNSDGSLNTKYLGSSFDLLVERDER